jgi:hypothetical protein
LESLTKQKKKEELGQCAEQGKQQVISKASNQSQKFIFEKAEKG